MVLQMIGVDYENADIHVRSAFAFQHHAVSDILTYIKENMNVSGAVLISTCNRTELYISAAEKITNLKEQMCFLGNASFETYSKYMTEREDTEVVDHLFKLACGMKSKIFGEDQIITQVKNSLTDRKSVV